MVKDRESGKNRPRQTCESAIGDVRFFLDACSLSVGASFPVYVCDFVGVGGMGDIAEGGRVLYL